MKHWQRIFSASLATVLLAGAVGCSSNNEGSTSGDTAKSTGEKPELVYWDMYYGPEETYGPAVQKVIDRYNSEDHGATVKVQMLGWDGFYEVFQTAVNSGSAPDISTGAYPGPVQYAAMGEALDVTSIVDQWRADNDPILDNFLPGALELHVYDGKQVAIPFNADPRAVFYRADILEDELGFKDLDKEVTWDTLLEICKKVKEEYGDEGVYPMALPFVGTDGMHTMINLMLSNGTGWANSSGDGPNYDDPKVMEVMEFFAELYNNGYIPEGSASYAGSDVDKLYSSEKCAIIWQWLPTYLYDNEDLMKRTKVMGGICGPSADQPRMTSWMNGIMGYQQTKYPEEVKEFLAWLPKNNKEVSTEGRANALPIRKSFYEDEYYQNDWLWSQVTRNAEYSTNPVYPSTVCLPAFGQIEGELTIQSPVMALLTGSTDFEGELKKANDSMQKAFDNFSK